MASVITLTASPSPLQVLNVSLLSGRIVSGVKLVEVCHGKPRQVVGRYGPYAAQLREDDIDIGRNFVAPPHLVVFGKPVDINQAAIYFNIHSFCLSEPMRCDVIGVSSAGHLPLGHSSSRRRVLRWIRHLQTAHWLDHANFSRSGCANSQPVQIARRSSSTSCGTSVGVRARATFFARMAYSFASRHRRAEACFAMRDSLAFMLARPWRCSKRFGRLLRTPSYQCNCIRIPNCRHRRNRNYEIHARLP